MAGRKEEVVISGIGGIFPESNNIEELKDLLEKKTNLVTIDSKRWDSNKWGIRNGIGKIKNVENFDAAFFKMHPKLAAVTDLLTSLSLERSIEAIIDAGLSPADIEGTNTGVFMSSNISEIELLFYIYKSKNAFSLLGQSRTMQANRLSYILNLTGPSFSMNDNWICSANNLEKAKTMIEDGSIKSALVGVCNLCLTSDMQYQFHGISSLNPGISTKPFSADAEGYNRSEACIVMLLQRASEAKRSYGTLLSVKSVQFGDHYGHITEHNKVHFKSLLSEAYKNAKISPMSVEYIEAYGSGIKWDDNIELDVMEEVFCTGHRKTPLKVGSVKSNVGHCGTSGLFMSIVKAIIALNSGYIPPSINYTENNDSHAAIKNGKIQIVTEKTPLVSDIIGISSFGLINAYSHVILKRNNKTKCSTKINVGIPRIILASGRNEENTRETVNMIMKYAHDTEFMALTYEVFSKNISNHFYRSFSIFPYLDGSQIHDVWNVDLKKRPVWYIFSGMGSQWQGMGLHLMKIPIFAKAIIKCDSILKPRGLDIEYILTSLDQSLFDNILNSFVGIAAIQIGLVDVLKALDIVPDGIIGHSVGELGCAYADGCFSAEEMMLSAYARGQASLETDVIHGTMAAIGLGYHQIKDRLPHDIDVACQNSASSCTLSGPVKSIDNFVLELQSEGVFAKTVNAAGIAYHSRYVQAVGPTLLKYLKEVIKEPKLRSTKWISSSIPESEWNSELAKYSSAEYYTNNLLSSVLFEDALKHIPSDAIVIEIAPHGLLQAILNRALPNTVSNIPLTKRMYGDSDQFLINAIGKMYSCGMNPKIEGIYPKITFPVSRETPSLTVLPLWDHTQKWSQQQDLLGLLLNKQSAEKFFSTKLSDENHLVEYQIHGHHIIPISFYLNNVWKLFVEMHSNTINSNPVQFQNLWFQNNIEIYPTNSSKNYILIQQGTGLFEYTIDNKLVFSGQISFADKNERNTNTIQSIKQDEIVDTYKVCFYKGEIYELLENNGYKLGDGYKNIIKFENSDKNIHGNVKWANDWVYFLDGLMKFTLLDNLETNLLHAPMLIREIKINPAMFNNIPESDVCVTFNKSANEIYCDGIKISDVKNSNIIIPKINSTVVKLEEKVFVQFIHSTWKNIDDFMNDSIINIILENNRFNLEIKYEKLIICTPYHYNDAISQACTTSLKQILEKQLFTNTIISMAGENIKITSKYDESGKFISVTNATYLLDTIKIMAYKKYGYIFVSSEQKLQNLKNWKIIMQQKFNDSKYLALFKKDIHLDENSIFVKDSYDDYDMSIWRTFDKYSTSRRVFYIISNSEPIEGLHNYVKNMMTKYKSQQLRFLFILDTNAPKLDDNKSFYKNQLAKGFLINIYKNGGWGFYKRVFIKDFKKNIKISEETSIVKNIEMNSENTHTLKFIGFNYKDVVVEDITKNELGPLEYSGVLENGRKVMGIATYEQKSSKINRDSLLSWSVPSTWSLEEATTVPLSYSLSYYVFNVLCSLQRGTSILITSGMHPIGHAAIAIGLTKKFEIFAVVESNLDVEQLSNRFPKLSRSRILINTNDQFDTSILMMTKSKGVNIVLNFLSGAAFQAAFRTISHNGKFFHFSKSDLKFNINIGTRVFQWNSSFTIVNSNMLLNESDHNKQIVSLAFTDGLNKDVIKPFPIFDFTNVSLNRNIFETMRTAFTLNPLQKVVLSLNDVLGYSKSLPESEFDTYQCCPDQVNLVISDNIDWLDVAEWLVNRGAQKIVIVVKRCLLSSFYCKRLDKLLSRKLSIQVEPDAYLKTKEKSSNWLNRLTSSNVLGLMFIVNQMDDKKIKNLRYAFEENNNKTKMTSFVCISSNGEQTCADLKSSGLNALNISWDENSSKPKYVSNILFVLDTLLLQSNTDYSSSIVCSEKGSNKLDWLQKINVFSENYVPVSIDDVYSLNEIIRKNPGFVEVQTRSPRLSQLKSVIPVFVIPGFRPKLFEGFYKQFHYPVFEARYPEDFGSIDDLSRMLINEIKQISNSGSVSLIGESWGGVMALKMAQMLEAQGTLVTISLLNCDPKTVTDWAECSLSKNCITNQLNTIYNSYSDVYFKYSQQTDEEDLRTLKMSVHKESLEKITKRVKNWIPTTLQLLLDNKPLPNKLHTKVFMFKYEKVDELNNSVYDLNDYCFNLPRVHIVQGTDYKQMMVDIKMIKLITKTVVYPTVGNKLALCEKYKNFYFNKKKFIGEF